MDSGPVRNPAIKSQPQCALKGGIEPCQLRRCALLTRDHRKIEQFLRLWHENGRAEFQRAAPSHNYDTEQRKIARGRRQYLLLNSGNDGVFLVQRSTQYVYQVDEYCRRGKFLNTLDALIEQYAIAKERHEEAEATIKTAGLDCEKKEHELLRALFTSVLYLHTFWDSLRTFEKELGHDVDDIEGLLGEAWPIDKPQRLNDLRPLLDRIRNHSAATGETAKEGRS